MKMKWGQQNRHETAQQAKRNAQQPLCRVANFSNYPPPRLMKKSPLRFFILPWDVWKNQLTHIIWFPIPLMTRTVPETDAADTDLRDHMNSQILLFQQFDVKTGRAHMCCSASGDKWQSPKEGETFHKQSKHPWRGLHLWPLFWCDVLLNALTQLRNQPFC